jgi:excisionase family DNA binding protein
VSAAKIIGIEAEELDARIEAAVRRAIGNATAPELVGPDEIAELLRTKRSSIPVLCARDGLPHTRVGRGYLFNVAHVVEWLEERGKKSGSHQRKHMAVVRSIKSSKKG